MLTAAVIHPWNKAMKREGWHGWDIPWVSISGEIVALMVVKPGIEVET